MGDHHSEEDQHAYPKECKCVDHGNEASFFCHQHIGNQCSRNNQKRQGNQCITACYKHIGEAAFTVKQSGEAPVCDNPQKQRQYNGNKCHEDICCVRILTAKDIAGSNGLIEERQYRYNQNHKCTAHASAFFMLQIPEAIKWMGNHVESIQQFFSDIFLTHFHCHKAVTPCSISHKLNNKNNNSYDHNRNHDEEIRNPFLTDLSVGIRISASVIGSLVVVHGIFKVAFSIQSQSLISSE